jgi:hypothetical protein
VNWSGSRVCRLELGAAIGSGRRGPRDGENNGAGKRLSGKLYGSSIAHYIIFQIYI